MPSFGRKKKDQFLLNVIKLSIIIDVSDINSHNGKKGFVVDQISRSLLNVERKQVHKKKQEA